jgi:hypothetical protein
VLGRDSDILVSPEGASLAGIDHFHRGVRHVARIQVIQETPTEVRILLLAEPGYSRSDGDELMRNVRRKLPSSMRVALEVTDSLERAASGKTPFVIHRPAVEEHLRGARHRRGSS